VLDTRRCSCFSVQTYPLARNIILLFNNLINSNHNIIFCWIPGHSRIKGNIAANNAAKSTTTLPITHLSLPASDFFPCIKKHINHRWQTLWQSFPNNKLYKIHSSISTIPPIHSFNRKDQVLINRLMIRHTRLTHSHLSKERPPMCTCCSTLLTVEHILTNCSHYQTIRHKFYLYSDLSNIFQVIPPQNP